MAANRGLLSPEAIEWYRSRAEGGASMIVVEATNTLSFEDELDGKKLRPLVKAIHSGGALAAIQIFPGMRGQRTAPGDMSKADIARLLADYALAAEACAEAGFDGIEPHGAHGFLLNQYFSPIKNTRKDEYGSSLQGRMRLALEITERIRPIAADAGMLLLFRHSPGQAGFGARAEDNLAFVKALIGAGLDILDVSPASDRAPADLSAPFMGLGIPVIAVNEMDEPPRALAALADGRADLIAIGRALIADPGLPKKLEEGREAEILRCLRCDHCFVDLRENVPVVCIQRK